MNQALLNRKPKKLSNDDLCRFITISPFEVLKVLLTNLTEVRTDVKCFGE